MEAGTSASSPFLTPTAGSLQGWDRRVRPHLVCVYQVRAAACRAGQEVTSSGAGPCRLGVCSTAQSRGGGAHWPPSRRKVTRESALGQLPLAFLELLGPESHSPPEGAPWAAGRLHGAPAVSMEPLLSWFSAGTWVHLGTLWVRGEKNGAERPAHPGSHGDTLPRPRRANPGGPRADTPPALAGSVQAGIQPLAPRSRRESRGGAGPARSGAPSPGPGAWGGAAGTCMQQGTGRGGGRRRGRAVLRAGPAVPCC